MSAKSKSRAFTLIELLVVVAIIALLISILLPSLKEAREQGKRAKCLANLRSIGQASHAYASEDPREHIVPIHMMQIASFMGQGFTGQWAWRTMNPFSYGGRTPIIPFPGSPGAPTTDPYGPWSANTRPLNLYVYGKLDGLDQTGMELYHCPSDRGYNEQNLLSVRHAPEEAIDVPCYEFTGNSYRMSVAGWLYISGSSSQGNLSIAPWGHRVSTLLDTGKLMMYSEPLFYSFTLQAPNGPDPDTIQLRGWHNKRMSDNACFADGSARMVTVDEKAVWDPDTLDKMGTTTCVQTHWMLRRGRHWRTDCYPTTGAWIRIRNGSGGWVRDNLPPNCIDSGWPTNSIQQNIVDPEY